MKKVLIWILCCVSVLTIQAQTEDVPISAGTDFYFTVFDHSPQHQQTVFLQIQATQLTRMTVKVGSQVGQYNTAISFMVGETIHPQPLDIVHIQTTEPCYISASVVGSKAYAETAILPTHLLGTSYMLQGMRGSLMELNGTPTQTYSQFSVIGTSNYTTLTIQSPVDLICVTNNQTIAAGNKVRFSISDEQVLLFQPVEYTNDITGVKVHANQPVAVFQGNNITRIPAGEDGLDYTWEQARPTTTWGTEFIVPKSELLQYNITKVTALENNTEVYRWNNGTPILATTLQSGESYSTPIDTYTPSLEVVHLQTSKPACCYLYFTGSSRNNNVGGPAMVEITPMDNPSTDTRWVMGHYSEGAPYQTRILVTMRADNQDNVLINNYPASTYSSSSVTTDDYVTYEMAYSMYQTMRIRATQGGFSAYTTQIGNTAEASAFNIALPETPYQQELCLDGTLLFREDFGGNDPSDPVFYSGSVLGMSSNYHNSKGTSMGSGCYVVTKKGYQNGIQWHRQDDHTYPNDFSRGYFLEVDGMGGTDAFFSTTINDLCAGMPLTFSAYVVNVTYAGQIPYLVSNFGYVYPRLKFVISDPTSGEVLASQSTGNILPDERYGTSETWKYARDNELSAEWQPVGINFIVPPGVSSVIMSIYNDVADGSIGNDFAIDDIEVRLCTPPVTIAAPDTVCALSPCVLTAQFENDDTYQEPLKYKWWHSADSIHWTVLPGSSATYQMEPEIADSGWYKVAVSSADGISSANCRSMSEPVKLVVKCCPPPPVTVMAPDTVCINTKNTFTVRFENNVSFPGQLEYQWYFSADSLTWEPLNEGDGPELKLKAKPRHSGWYRVAVSREGNIHSENCRVISEPHKFFVIEDCPPILCPEGLLLLHRDYNSAISLCDTVIEQICSPLDLSLIVNLPPNHAETRLIFRLLDPSTGNELSAYDTGDVPSDSLQVGTTFMIPDGVNSLRWVISNNLVGSIGQPFAIDNIEIRLCLEPISIETASTACRKKPFTMQALYDNYGILQQPEYQWYFSEDSAGWYHEIDTATIPTLTIPEVHKSHEGWYRVAVSEQGQMAYPHCRSMSEPFHLLTQYCNTAVEQHFDTTACDTLLEYHLTWRGHEWPAVGILTDTLRDIDTDDSVYVHLTLQTHLCCPNILTFHTDTAICDTLLPFVWQTEDFSQEYTAVTTDKKDIPHVRWTNCTGKTYYLNLDIYHCCPEIVRVDVDSAVCDTLLPFTWLIDGQTFVFQKPEIQEREVPHSKWQTCTGTVYTLTLDTFHCERLYPIIVNKYNWQLLLDNPTLRRLFPDRQFLAYQWYKNDEAIPGATEDDYAEQNELCGRYQLCIRLDQAVDNDDEYIWSNILEIGEPAAPLPVTKRIYNSSGIQIREDRMTRGVYFILYQQGDKYWTEKRLVP